MTFPVASGSRPGSCGIPAALILLIASGSACRRVPQAIRVELRPMHIQGLDPGRARGLQSLVRATLPLLGPVNLLPETCPSAPPGSGTWRIQMLAEGRGEELRLGLRFSRDQGNAQERWLPWLPAHEALRAWFGLLPFPSEEGTLVRLLPKGAGSLFRALDLRAALARQETWSEAEVISARHLAAGEPDLDALLVHGRLHGALLVHRGNQPLNHRTEAEEAFVRVLARSPGHPEASTHFAKLRTDLGQHGEALHLLQEGLKAHPCNYDLLRQLAYSARYAGLMDLALAAVTRLEAVSGGPLGGIENTLLYEGQWDRFASAVVREGEVVGWWPAHRFFHAYAALAAGDRAEAVRRLDAHPAPWGPSRFGLLGAVYESIARGEREEGLRRLATLREASASARYPDGEFLLKVAEASCLLGDSFGALELLQRAHIQGFACASWCVQSPFLGPIRSMPRFRLVVEQMEARRRILMGVWTVESFGLGPGKR